jgi:Domain of unknown function (DUF4062)/inactive STAND
MARIYISSTSEDLREERDQVRNTIMAWHHEPAAMEWYGADEQAPVERCIDDVRKCDFYLAIIAFRYGFTPDKYDRSITELEYEAAGAKGVPRSIFLLDEKAPWPINRVDRDRTRIDNFRQRLCKAHTVKFFLTAMELGAYVRDFLRDINSPAQAKGTPEKEAPEIPFIVPYLCNRDQQRDQLIDIKENGSKRRPLVCLVHGDTRQAHDQFSDKLRDYVLPEILGTDAVKPQIKDYPIKWPVCSKDRAQICNLLLRRISEKVLRRIDGSTAEIQKVLREIPAPVMIYSTYRNEDWNECGRLSIDCFLEMWSKWPQLDPDQRLFVFLFVKYPRQKKGLFRVNFWDTTTQLQKVVQANHDPKNCRWTIKPLTDVPQTDPEDWADRDDVGIYRKPAELKRQVEQVYVSWKRRNESSDIPMEDLAPELRRILRKEAAANEENVA